MNHDRTPPHPRRGPRRVARLGDARRYVYVAALRCPRCGARQGLLAYKTRREPGDGTVSRYTRCAACDWRFIVVEE